MNTLATAQTSPSIGHTSTRRLATASSVGTTLEWYDFTVYNTLAALIFNRLFFPSFDPLSGTILAFSTYAVGYVSRPIGGVLFGHLGDKRGRRVVLVITLVLMGITTGLMGLLPTYARVGIASPILLVMLRFVQGVALGGEWAGAVLISVEHGAQHQRGRNAALSDRVGRRPVYAAGALLGMLWAFVFFVLLESRRPALIVIAVVIGLVIHSAMFGPQAAFVTEQFPTRVRYAGSSLAYTLAGIAGGGFAPLIFASLFGVYRTSTAISVYVVATLCVTGVALLMARETANSPLEE